MKTLLLILSLLVPGAVMAEGVLTPAANPPDAVLYDYRTKIVLQDDFNTGGTTTASIGRLGFLSSGTITSLAAATNRLGVVRLDTGAGSGTNARINFASTNAILPALPTTITWVAQLNTNDANTTVRLGAFTSVSASPPDHGIFFEKLDGDTNWFCVTRASATGTRTDSGVAVSTSYATFVTDRTAAGVQFRLNGALVCTHTTNIPTVAVAPIAFIINSTAAAKTIDVDYFEMTITGLTR